MLKQRLLKWNLNCLIMLSLLFISDVYLLCRRLIFLCLPPQVFCSRLTEEAGRGSFPPEVIRNIFANISSIYSFHSQFLLPDLENCITHWWVFQRVGTLHQLATQLQTLLLLLLFIQLTWEVKAHNLYIIIKLNAFALLSKLLFHFKANVNQHIMTPYICPLVCLNVGVRAQAWVRFFCSTHPSWGCTLTTSETSTMQWSWWGPGPNAPLLSETSSRTYR